MDKGSLAEAKSLIRSLLVSSSSSMTIQDLERDFKKMVHTELPYRSLGYTSAEKLLRTLPDVVKITGYGSHALVHYVPNEKSQHINNLIQNQKTSTDRRGKCNANPRGRRRLPRRNKSTFEDNEYMMDFGSLTMEDYGPLPSEKPLPFSFYESESTVIQNHAQISQIPELQHRSENKKRQATPPKETPILHESNNSIGSIKAETKKNISIQEQLSESSLYKQETLNNGAAAKKTLNNSQTIEFSSKSRANTQPYKARDSLVNGSNHSTNDDAVRDRSVDDKIENVDKQFNIKRQSTSLKLLDIPKCKVYEEFEKGSIIPIFISEILDPFKFFFHIDQEDHELLKLEDRMQKFYTTKPKCMNMPNSFLKCGRICAAKNGDKWYRAKILSLTNYFINFTRIKILFIDYGCVAQVPRKHLKLLPSEFFNVPIQVAEGRLARIKSDICMRSARATNYFKSLANDRCLYAYVTEVDKDTPALDLILVDTNVQPKCNINRALIKFGFTIIEDDS